MLYDLMRDTNKTDAWFTALLVMPVALYIMFAICADDKPDPTRLVRRLSNFAFGLLLWVAFFYTPTFVILAHGGTAIDLMTLLAADALVASILYIALSFRWSDHKSKAFESVLTTFLVLSGLTIPIVGLGGLIG